MSFLFLISFFFAFSNNTRENEEETRAVYFSYIEFDNYILDKDDTTQKKNINEIINNIKLLGLNRIILHVRAFSDSIYKSNYYPISKHVLNNNQEYPGYDVLDYFIKAAHKNNIKIDAWINPYRISNSKDINSLDKDSVYYKYSDSKVTEKGIYLNPGNIDVQN